MTRVGDPECPKKFERTEKDRRVVSGIYIGGDMVPRVGSTHVGSAYSTPRPCEDRRGDSLTLGPESGFTRVAWDRHSSLEPHHQIDLNKEIDIKL